MSTTISTIKEVVAKLRRQPELAVELDDDADLVDEIMLDSLEMLQFMLELEDKLQVRIDFEALEFSYLHSLRRLAVFLDAMPAAAASDA